MGSFESSLKEKIVRGGAYLITRQGLGLLIGLGGVILLTRAIGPKNYGLYATALGIVGYISNLTGLGVNVYLIRKETEPGTDVYRQAFTLTFFSGMSGMLLGVAALPLLRRWFHNPDFIPPLLTMMLVLPFTAMTGTAMARLERDVNYRAVAAIELTGQIIYYIVTLALAYLGKGVWAPVSGYLIWQSFLLVGSCKAARLIPRPYWSRSLLQEMLTYGGGYSASIWVWQLRTLVNPLIVGRYLGPEGVGYTALSIRLVETLGFVKDAVWRLSIAALAKLREDRPRLKRVMEEAMSLQVLALGPLLAIFAAIAPWFLPLFFGKQWNVILIIYPFISLGFLVNAVFNLHSSVLYVLHRNWEVTLFHIVHIFLFTGGAYLLLPRMGLPGYGMAEMLALFSYMVLHLQVKHLFFLSYKKAILGLISFVPPLFINILALPAGLLLWIPLLVVLALPDTRRTLAQYPKNIKTRR